MHEGWECSKVWWPLTQIRPCWKLQFPLQTPYQWRKSWRYWKQGFGQMMLWNQMPEGCRSQVDSQRPERCRNRLWRNNSSLSSTCSPQQLFCSEPSATVVWSWVHVVQTHFPSRTKWISLNQQGSLEEHTKSRWHLSPPWAPVSPVSGAGKKRCTEITAGPPACNSKLLIGVT